MTKKSIISLILFSLACKTSSPTPPLVEPNQCPSTIRTTPPVILDDGGLMLSYENAKPAKKPECGVKTSITLTPEGNEVSYKSFTFKAKPGALSEPLTFFASSCEVDFNFKEAHLFEGSDQKTYIANIYTPPSTAFEAVKLDIEPEALEKVVDKKGLSFKQTALSNYHINDITLVHKDAMHMPTFEEDPPTGSKNYELYGPLSEPDEGWLISLTSVLESAYSTVSCNVQNFSKLVGDATGAILRKVTDCLLCEKVTSLLVSFLTCEMIVSTVEVGACKALMATATGGVSLFTGFDTIMCNALSLASEQAVAKFAGASVGRFCNQTSGYSRLSDPVTCFLERECKEHFSTNRENCQDCSL